MSADDVLVITGGAGGMGLACAPVETLRCDVRIDGGLVGAGKHMLGVG